MYFNGYEDIFVADIAFDSGKSRGLEPATMRFDTFTKTVIAPETTHTYGVGIHFEKI